MLAGYLLGSLSPATLFSKLKKVDLKRVGTKNPGAANALLMLGRGYGAAVMLLDMAKAAVSVLLARALFPASAVAPLLAGGFAILGHIFPFYMGFAYIAMGAVNTVIALILAFCCRNILQETK